MKIINPLDFKDWNQIVSGLSGCTIFHTSNWARVIAGSYGYKPTYFCDAENGKITNVLPIMQIKSFITGSRGVSLPFSDQVNPIVSNKNNFRKLFEKAVDFAREYGWKSIDFHGGDLFFDTKKAYNKYVTCKIKLKQDTESLFINLKGNTRRNINKAKELGVRTEISNSLNSIKEFYRLNCISRRDHGLPPQPFFFFKKIHEYIIQEEMGFVCLGYYNNKAIAGVVFLIFNGEAIFKYGASEKKYLSLRPNNIVLWEALKHSLYKGADVLNLGRTEMHHEGLLQYKRGWNIEESCIHYFKFNIDSRQFVNSKSGLKSSYGIFSRLPIPVLKTIGTILYRHVG